MYIVCLYLRSKEQVLLVFDRDLIRIAIIDLILVVIDLSLNLGHLIILSVHLGPSIE